MPAAPSVLRRRLAVAQAGLLVGIGTLLGVFGGITPAAGMVTFRPDLEWHVPWLPLAITVLFTPAFAGAATASHNGLAASVHSQLSSRIDLAAVPLHRRQRLGKIATWKGPAESRGPACRGTGGSRCGRHHHDRAGFDRD